MESIETEERKFGGAQSEEAPEESTEAVIEMLRARLELPKVEVLELIDEIVEAFSPCPSAAGQSAGAVPAGLDSLRQLDAKYRKAFHLLVAYQENQKTLEQALMSTKAICLVLGIRTAAGANNVAELGRKTGFKKQTVGKCADHFRKKMDLPIDQGQRNEQARKNMTDARNKQLKKQL